jgi:hypothetical protein
MVFFARAAGDRFAIMLNFCELLAQASSFSKSEDSYLFCSIVRDITSTLSFAYTRKSVPSWRGNMVPQGPSARKVCNYDLLRYLVNSVYAASRS